MIYYENNWLCIQFFIPINRAITINYGRQEFNLYEGPGDHHAEREIMWMILCMYALFAAEFPLAKLALRETNAFFLETLRMLIGGTALLGFYFFRNNFQIRIARQDWFLFGQLIFFYMYLSYFGGSWALQYISSLKANLLYSMVPFVSAALGYLLLRDKPTLNKIMGMSLGVSGLILILLNAESSSVSRAEFLHIALPEIVMLVSIFSTEYGYFLLKRLFDKGYPLVLINGLAMFVGGTLSLSTAFLVFEEQVIQYSSLSIVLGYALLLFVLINSVDIALYGKLIKKYSITFLTFAGFLTPIFGVLYGTIFMGESLSYVHIGAFGLIFLGLYLFSREDTKLHAVPATQTSMPVEPAVSENKQLGV